MIRVRVLSETQSITQCESEELTPRAALSGAAAVRYSRFSAALRACAQRSGNKTVRYCRARVLRRCLMRAPAVAAPIATLEWAGVWAQLQGIVLLDLLIRHIFRSSGASEPNGFVTRTTGNGADRSSIQLRCDLQHQVQHRTE